MKSLFTLVEALIAMVLIAIIVPVSLQAILLCQRVELSATRGQVALDLAENLLLSKIHDTETKLSSSEGNFDVEHKEYTWKISMSDWIDSNMNVITIEVYYPLQGDKRSVSLSTLINSN